MRSLQQRAAAMGAVALAATLGTTVAAQEPRPERLGESIERTIEAVASLVEHNAERWARAFETNAERWAGDIERHAGRWAEAIERHAESVAVIVAVEAQQSERAREAAERAREQREEAQERARERRERAQEQARQARERQREQGRSNGRREATEQFTRTVRLGRNGTFDIETMSGDITITGNNGSDVQIEAVKRVRAGDDARARELLSELRVDVNERPGRVEVRTIHPRPQARGRGVDASVDFTIAVPSGVDVFVKTMSGEVRVTSVRGELQAETMSGDVTVAGAARVRLAKTMSGDVQISDSDGEITAGTMSGDVVVRSVRGRNLSVSTISGDMLLTDIDVERADVRSTNGEIDFTGRLQKGGRYELNTHQGDVRLTPLGNTGFDVESSTFNGNIVSQFQMKVTRDSGSERGMNRVVRGTYGDGGAYISLRSFNGDITIVRK